jgi:hypothetical protein
MCRLLIKCKYCQHTMSEWEIPECYRTYKHSNYEVLIGYCSIRCAEHETL